MGKRTRVVLSFASLAGALGLCAFASTPAFATKSLRVVLWNNQGLEGASVGRCTSTVPLNVIYAEAVGYDANFNFVCNNVAQGTGTTAGATATRECINGASVSVLYTALKTLDHFEPPICETVEFGLGPIGCTRLVNAKTNKSGCTLMELSAVASLTDP